MIFRNLSEYRQIMGLNRTGRNMCSEMTILNEKPFFAHRFQESLPRLCCVHPQLWGHYEAIPKVHTSLERRSQTVSHSDPYSCVTSCDPCMWQLCYPCTWPQLCVLIRILYRPWAFLLIITLQVCSSAVWSREPPCFLLFSRVVIAS